MKVREVEGLEGKSVQEVENELLDKHNNSGEEGGDAGKDAEVDAVGDPKPDAVSDAGDAGDAGDSTPTLEIKDEDVLSYIKSKHGKEVKSLDDLFKAPEQKTEVELPEDVKAYFEYKKETGRSIEDYVKLNRNIDDADPDRILKDYLLIKEKGLDEDDVEILLDEYSYDEDLDDEATIRKAKLRKKRAIAEAKDFFKSEKEKYRVPLESSGSSISDEDKKQLEEYRQYMQEATTYEEEASKRAEWFSTKTQELFGSEFKGFEFTVDEDKSLTFSPGDSAELKSIHSNPQKFINKFLDDKGLLSDVKGYHKSLAVAMNPEKFAKFFYEQGKSAGTDDVIKKTKNVNMSSQRTPEITTKGGTKVRSVNPDSGNGLRIRSRK